MSVHRDRNRLFRHFSLALPYYWRFFLGCSVVSFVVLLIVTAASAIFVYQVSPLRNPAFQPNSANAGTLVWWLQDVREDDWMLAAFILSGLLAINFTLVLWYLRILTRETILFWHFLFSFGTWLLLWYVFVFYLLGKWLVY